MENLSHRLLYNLTVNKKRNIKRLKYIIRGGIKYDRERIRKNFSRKVKQ